MIQGDISTITLEALWEYEEQQLKQIDTYLKRLQFIICEVCSPGSFPQLNHTRLSELYTGTEKDLNVSTHFGIAFALNTCKVS